MAGRGRRTRAVNAAEGRAYLTKADEFLYAARESLAAANHSAAVGNAVHAGILAADAICAVELRLTLPSSDRRNPVRCRFHGRHRRRCQIGQRVSDGTVATFCCVLVAKGRRWVGVPAATHQFSNPRSAPP